jgi:alanine racemase
VATVALGYADGLPRSLSNRGRVLIGGKSCPIIGRVCMDLVMADVSRAGRVRPGSRAVLLGRQGRQFISIQEWARLDKSIAYESLTRISARVPRLWVGA